MPDLHAAVGGPARSARLKGSLAILFGAAIWGLFWIPLRFLADAGLGGFWPVACTLAGGLPVAVALAMLRGTWRQRDAGWTLFIGTGLGLSTILYFAAVIQTDVVRAIFLFYMLPIWAILVDRLVFGVRLNAVRAGAVLLAFAGLWLLLGGDGGVPVPRNVGDWMALASGFCWGATLAVIKGKADVDPYWNAAAALCVGALGGVAVALGVDGVDIMADNAGLNVFVVAVCFGTVLLLPSMLGQLWGARLVPAARAALLTMVEIVVATVSAWALIGTSLTRLSFAGGAIIVTAVLIDIYANREEAE